MRVSERSWSMMTFLCVLWLAAVVALSNELSPPPNNETNKMENVTSTAKDSGPKGIALKQLIAERAERFTAYHSYFQSHKLHNRYQCLPQDHHNQTWLEVDAMIDSCPRGSYYPRHILRSHISWKPTNSSPKKPTPAANATTNDVANSTSGGESSTGNRTTEDANKTKDATADDANNDKNDKVHDFLVLGLLMPDHPYSEEFFATLVSVGPMFPQVTFITGNAYEFQDIASKYSIDDFPTVLLFKNGLFQREYFNRNPSKFAAHIAAWTKSLPRSLPGPFRVPTSKRGLLSSHGTLRLPPYLSWLQPIFDVIPLPTPNLEPFIGSVAYHQEIELVVFVSATLYTLFRGLYLVRNAFR